MDCIQAQAIISEALDRSPVDAEVLEAAKKHCRECPECATFVRALGEVKRAPLPAPPADLADRIIAAVRAEASGAGSPAEADAAVQVAAVADESLADALEGAIEEMPHDEPVPAESAESIALRQAAALAAATAESRLSVGRGPHDRNRTLVWMGVGAAALILVGVVGALGVMRLVGGRSSAAPQVTEMAKSTSGGLTGSAPSAGGADSQYGSATAPSAAQAAATSQYVVYAGVVYVRTGVADAAAGQAPIVGNMTLAFTSGKTPVIRAVRATDAANRIYLVDDAGVLQSFDVVTRTYQGTTYSLRSTTLQSIGAWPTLPAGIQTPASADGSPYFVLDSGATSDTPVYHRVGATARQGIAIPPNTMPPDTANGNPYWTWWAPR